jgi:hypothetical protein
VNELTEKTQLAIISPEMFSLQVTPAVIAGNFADMKALVIATLEERKALVTPETIQGGKTQAADFRKTAKALMAAWKEHRLVSMEDILLADEQVKDICSLLENGANQISEQVKAIEQETKDICEKLLAEYIKETWEGLGVDKAFQTAKFEDLVKLGSLNKKNELTPATIKELVNRCKLDKAEQVKQAQRVSELQNRCYQADIKPVLDKGRIAHCITWGDELFEAELNKIIKAEVDRKEESERLMREKVEKELEAKKQQEIKEALAAQQAEANRLAKIEADRIAKEAADRAKAEATKPEPIAEPVPVQKTVEQRLKDLIESDAVYPDEGKKQRIAELKKQLQPVAEAPSGSEMLTVKIHYMTSITYPFSTKPGADREKIKAFFKRRAVADGVAEESITNIEVLNG